MAIRLLVPLALALLVGGGCTHAQLRRNTVNQARTLSDLHQQQVLNNLAMFVANPDALPYFAYPNDGINQVTDTGATAANVAWVVAGFDSAGLGLEASRAANEVWNLSPVNDPHKLALMRCAYQMALQSAGRGTPSAGCPDCGKRLGDFYKGHAHEGADAGQTDVSCLSFAPNWFCVGTRKDVPKDCCVYSGHYCGVYVWVPPHGRNELTKLSLAILDFALHSPEEPPVRTKAVTLYLDPTGKEVKQSEASRIVTTEVPLETKNKDLDPLLLGKEEEKMTPRTPVPANLRYDLRPGSDRRRERPSLLQLRQELETIRSPRGGR